MSRWNFPRFCLCLLPLVLSLGPLRRFWPHPPASQYPKEPGVALPLIPWKNLLFTFLPLLQVSVLHFWEPSRWLSCGASCPDGLPAMVTRTRHKGYSYTVPLLYESRNGLWGETGLDQQPGMHHAVGFLWLQTLSSRNSINLKHQNYELLDWHLLQPSPASQHPLPAFASFLSIHQAFIMHE